MTISEKLKLIFKLECRKRYPLSIVAIIFLTFGLNNSVFGQTNIGLNTFSHNAVINSLIIPKNLSSLKFYIPQANTSVNIKPIPIVFSVEKLPFFCKIEHNMSKGVKMPIKFRLGTLEYVDKLEGKIRE